jgi:hypothetical protein
MQKNKENTSSLLEDEEKGPEEDTGLAGIDYKAQAENYNLKQAAHPRACIFTVLFKAAAILRCFPLNSSFHYILATFFLASYSTLSL